MYEPEYSAICGNCGNPLNADDFYCRKCGTKRGEGKFEPRHNMIQCIYGPAPVKRIRKCTKCKKKWETMMMVDNQNFCPDCGAPSTIIMENGRRVFGAWFRK